MQNRVKESFYRLMPVLLGMLLLALIFNPLTPAVAFAASQTLEIAGDGVANPLTFTREQLAAMEQHQEIYSCINTWPTKRWYVGKGVKLWDLLLQAGIKEDAAQIRFTSTDSYTVLLTIKELFEDKRYRFPHFKSTADSDGHLPGDPAGAVPVEPLIGLSSVEGSDNPKYMNETNTFLLMLGQRAVTEQTGNLFVKYLSKIEVSTAEPEKWDSPQANPGGGTVPAGTMVALNCLHNDDDKVYYTTDGSIPTLNSPMYNWIASRWWPARADVLGAINKPVGPINKDTTIKAITIGPGKQNSDVVTFKYKVAGAGPGSDTGLDPGGDDREPAGDSQAPAQPPAKVIRLTIGRKEAGVNGKPCILEAAPFINMEAGRTLVPLRFISEALGAAVDWNPEAKKITITGEGGEIILILGSKKALVNGLAAELDCAPELRNNRTFVPLRFVSETLQAKVDYNAGEITITD